jgi:polysaccharide deacetylase family protein (PEP-CTERM system associated)
MSHPANRRNPVLTIESDFLNAFTVDVEDYFQVSAFEHDIERKCWDTYPCRVVDNTQRLLSMLTEYNVKATFFLVGWIAERHPQLVAEIRHAGHEIGSHSYWHRLVYRLTPDEFRQDLRRSRKVLEDILGEPIRVFRAPSFSITQRSRWALEILVEEGFSIDSSIFPIYHDRYGMPNANPAIHRLPTPAGLLWECPPSVVRVAGFNLPVSGGGYFRLYPGKLSIRWLRQVNQLAGRPFVFYLHPWEIDPGQPRLRAGSRLSRWRHYLNLHETESKLQRLLSCFRFGTLTDVVAWANDPPARAKPIRIHQPLVSERPV